MKHSIPKINEQLGPTTMYITVFYIKEIRSLKGKKKPHWPVKLFKQFKYFFSAIKIPNLLQTPVGRKSYFQSIYNNPKEFCSTNFQLLISRIPC